MTCQSEVRSQSCLVLEGAKPLPARRPSLPIRLLWLALGLFLVFLALLGILLPGLPTTPFLLLAAACFARSSQRLYERLLASRLGPTIREFRAGRGIPRRVRYWAIGTMWVFVVFALVFGLPADWLSARIIVAVAAIIGTIAICRLSVR